MDEFNSFHGNLSGFIRVIGIGAEFAPISFTISIADGVTMAVHSPSQSKDQLDPCSAEGFVATDFSSK